MARIVRLLAWVALAVFAVPCAAAQQGGETVDIPRSKPPKSSKPPKRPPSGGPRTPSAALVGAFPAPESRLAILVGADGAADGARGATDDARSLADVLVRNAAFPKAQMLVVASDPTADAQPTREGILQAIGARPAPGNGLLLFYFAGTSVDVDGGVYLLPKGVSSDAGADALKQSAISADELRERLVATGASQIVVILDTCRNDPDPEGPPKTVVSRAYPRQFSLAGQKLKAHALFLPASVGEGAYVMSGRGRGYFTAGLVEALKGGAATRQGEVTLHRLAVFAREWVAQRLRNDYERKQTPDVDLAGYRADDVVVARGYAPLGANVVAILHTEPDDPDVTGGAEAMDRGDFAVAAEAFQRAASRTPDNPYIHVRLSLAFQGLKKYQEAADAMERAVALDSTKSDWLAELGHIYYMRLDDADRALGAFERAYALDPSPRMRSDLGIILFEVGNRHFKQGRYEEAAGALARARELNPKIAADVTPALARAYSRLGAAHLAAGRTSEAIASYGKAVEVDATNVDALVGLGTAHLKAGDLAAARQVVERLGTVNPSWAANLQKQIDAATPKP